MNKKECLYLIIFLIGILYLISTVLYLYFQGILTYYECYSKKSIIIGFTFTIVCLFLFIFKRYKIFEKKGFLSKKLNFLETFLIIILVLSLGIGVFVFYDQYFSIEEKEYEWSIGIYISSSSDPLNLTDENINNPVLVANDVTDIQAKFVADPFLVYKNYTYFLFFEVMNIMTCQGDIGLATSYDGFNWSYKQIVLDETFHLSYPCVFKWKNEYFMIPETKETRSVRLYKSDDFPYKWSFVKTLLKGMDFVDNTIFYYNDIWWLFTETSNCDTLRLYYSESPLDLWIEHPRSPVIIGDANIARPGGNVIVFNNQVIRFGQDDYPYYGNQVWAFEINKLTKIDYKEHKIGITPILKGFDNWNTVGMHHISLYATSDNKWIAAVDGKGQLEK